MVFESEITEILNRPLYRVDHPTGDTLLTPSILAEKIRQQTGDSLHLTSLQFFGEKDKVCLARFTETARRSLAVDPYTGTIKGWIPKYSFFQVMRNLHRWLLDTPPQRDARTVGKTLVGLSVLSMVIILISGLILGWPRRRSLWKQRFQIACHQGKRRFWYDCHVALGFYAILFLCLMALTGLSWSFGWYQTAAYRLFGAQPTQTAHTSSTQGAAMAKSKAPSKVDYTLWDRIWAEVPAHYPSYATLKLSTNQLEVTHGVLGTRKDHWIMTDQPTGEERLTPDPTIDRTKQVRSAFYAFHVGSWGGWVTKVLYFLAALIGGTLPLSGYYLWWMRLRKKHAAQSSHPSDQKSELV